jgi:hypothetical protein
MNFDNLPSDEAGREIALNAELNALNNLVQEFQFEDASSFVMGTIHNEIELVERCLEFGVDYVKADQYESDAKNDYRTDI